MKMTTTESRIALTDTQPAAEKSAPALVFIHGHCTDKSFFSKQMSSPLLSGYRCVALDLPGYGESEPPKNPEKVYSFPGFASVVEEVISQLGLDNFIIVGWSLGGHVALELTQKLQNLKGILITGTPPIEVSLEGLAKGFKALEPEIMECFGKPCTSREEAELLSKVSGYDYSDEKQFLVDAILNTDVGAKTIYPASIAKKVGANEVEIVKTWAHPIAVVAGEDDIAINNEYIMNEVPFKNLWRGEVQVIQEAGHAAHLEKVDEFNQHVRAFADEVFGV